MTGHARTRAALPAAVAVALVVSAALLLLGVIFETNTAGAAPTTTGAATAGHNEATEHGAGAGEAAHSTTPEPATPEPTTAPASVAAAPATHSEATERGGEQGEAATRAAAAPLPTTAAAAAGTMSSPAGPSPVQGEAGHSDTPGTVDAANGQGETVLGIPIESPIPVGAAVLVSLALAVAVWRRPTRPVSLVVILVAAAAGVLDVAEIVHQLGAGRTGLVLLAGLVAALHLLVILGAARLWAAHGARPARTDR